MGIFSRKKKEERITEAAFPMVGPTGGGIDPDEHLYRPISKDPGRSLPPWKQERQTEAAFYFWKTNPLAYRIIEMQASYIVGEGAKVRAVDPSVQRVLDRFWFDPVTNMPKLLKQAVRFLGVFGEQLFRVFTDPASGACRLGYIDPASINAVHLNPENALVIDSVSVRRPADTPAKLTHVNVNDEDGLRRGDCYYWSINRPPNAPRGTSDLLPMIDALDGLDSYMYANLDRVSLQTMAVFDVTVKGASQEQLQDYLNRLPTLKPGGIRAHNDRTEWKTLSPEVGSETTDFGKMLKNYIGVGAGLPPHYLGEEGSANRATASEMGVPVVQGLKSRQAEIRCFLTELLDYVIDAAIMAGQVDSTVDRRFDVVLPTIWGVDTGRISDATTKLSMSLDAAVNNGWINNEEAGAVFRHTLGQLGVDLEKVDEATGQREESPSLAAALASIA